MDNRDNTSNIGGANSGNEGRTNQAPDNVPTGEPAEVASPEPQPSVSQPTPVASNETDTSEESSMGPIIGAIIIVLILIIGGLYFWGQNLVQNEDVADDDMEELLDEDEVTEELQEQSSSDEVDDIEADLEASSYEEIDADLANIEEEL